MKNKKICNELLYFEEEMQWRKEQRQKDFGREILETMSYREASDLLTPLMENQIDVKSSFDKNYRQICRIGKKYYAPETLEFDLAVKLVWVLKFAKEDIKNQDRLKELERYWLFNESRKPFPFNYKQPKEDFNLLIEEAKKVPIETLNPNPCKRSGNNTLVSLCPFHKEKTPSFTIFINTNTFFCFGCQAKGDGITFYQNIYGVEFVDAVRNLTKQY